MGVTRGEGGKVSNGKRLGLFRYVCERNASETLTAIPTSLIALV